MTNLIGLGLERKESSEITIAEKEVLTLAGYSPDNEAFKVEVFRKMSDGYWLQVAHLSFTERQINIIGKGTYKLIKPEGRNVIIDRG